MEYYHREGQDFIFLNMESFATLVNICACLRSGVLINDDLIFFGRLQ
jgi:hypothetical protein